MCFNKGSHEANVVCRAAIMKHVEPVPIDQVDERGNSVREDVHLDCKTLILHGICAADVGPGELKDAFHDAMATSSDNPLDHNFFAPYSRLKAIVSASHELDEWIEMSRKFYSTDGDGMAMIRKDIGLIIRRAAPFWLELLRWQVRSTINWYRYVFFTRLKAWKWRGDFDAVVEKWFWQKGPPPFCESCILPMKPEEGCFRCSKCGATSCE